MSTRKKKPTKPTEDSAKETKDNITVGKAQKVNSDDAAAKARLNMIVQILPSDSTDHNVDIAIKHLRQMISFLDGKPVKGCALSKTPAFIDKLSLITDMLSHNATGDKNVTIAVESLKPMWS